MTTSRFEEGERGPHSGGPPFPNMTSDNDIAILAGEAQALIGGRYPLKDRQRAAEVTITALCYSLRSGVRPPAD